MMADTRALKLLINETIEENPSICTLKTDVGVLKTDVGVLKTDVGVLKQDVRELKSSVNYLGVMMEDMQHNQKLILDAVIPAQQRAAQTDAVVAKVENHEHRICAVEAVIKEREL